MLCSRPFQTTPGLILTDLVVHMWDDEAIPAADLSQPALALESLTGVGLAAGWYRLTHLHEGPQARTLTVALAGTPTVPLFTQSWDSNVYDAELLALFQVTPSIQSVSITVLTAQNVPIPGVEVSIWSADFTVCVVPRTFTNTDGIALCGLPAGNYKVLFYKAFVAFSSNPLDISVTVPIQGPPQQQ